MDEVDLSKIQKLIYTIRGKNVMLDSDLADLYGVETRTLIQAVKRNKDRFPPDFMIECDYSCLDDLRSQIVIANSLSPKNHMRRSLPLLFTENGVAMLSTVLNSKKAIQVNIQIMRIFTKLRSFLFLEKDLSARVDGLEKGTTKTFRIVFEKLDELEIKLEPHLPSERKKIGLNKDEGKPT